MSGWIHRDIANKSIRTLNKIGNTMSKHQYNLRKPTDYLKRRMFLDGAVTVQRFEEYRYPRLEKFESLQRGFFWVPDEIGRAHV